MAINKLSLSAAHWQAMLAHARQAWPEEACGLLAGPPGRVERLDLVENVLHSPHEYTMDPDEQVRIMLEIEAAGWEVGGIFHSHPAGPPVPSATDVARAYYPEAVYIILAPVPGGDWSGRAFEIDQGRVREVDIVVTG